MDKFLTPIARLFIGHIFLLAGFSKIGQYAGTQGYMEAMGVPGMLLPVVIALELIGGIAVLIGYQTKIAAFLLGGFTFLAAVIFHSNFGDQMQMIMFMKNMALAGGFLMIVSLGAGPYSIDNRMRS